MRFDKAYTDILAVMVAILVAGVSSGKPATNESAIKWVAGVGNSLSQPPEFYGSEEAIRIAPPDDSTAMPIQARSGPAL